ncbi:MAG: hypothetical protein HOP10_01595 [Chitinophagaceae bacterium]|nr:hypothetical protein [Chitinophagaceae bacterium]
MALNKNHEFEELNGIKCGIVEKNAKPERIAFLKELLELNGYTIVTVQTPPPKVAAPPPPKEGEPVVEAPPPPPAPETFTMGVTDYTFNPINAIFGRMLKTKKGSIVTWAYWNQEEMVNDDEVPYYEK